MIGTVPYLSPERVRGQQVDRRADIYGLGIVLYELTTGQRLFRGADPFPRIARGAIPPPVGFRRGYPAAIEGIVMRAVHNNPAERHRTALELQLERERVASQLGVVMSSPRVAQFRRVRVEQHSRADTAPWEPREPALDPAWAPEHRHPVHSAEAPHRPPPVRGRAPEMGRPLADRANEG